MCPLMLTSSSIFLALVVYFSPFLVYVLVVYQFSVFKKDFVKYSVENRWFCADELQFV